MTTEIPMRREGSRLVPVNEMAAEDLARVPGDRDVFVTVRCHRNPKHHRLAWALAQKLSEACDFLHDREDAMAYLKIKCRHVQWVGNPKPGRTFMIPKSISFASLDQASFSRLFDRMVFVVCNDIVPGLKESDLRREIEAMVTKP